MASLPPLIRLMRPRQWYKNVLLILPLLFSGNARTYSLWIPAGLAFIGFCLLSSATYAANDVLDVERDRAHPTKRNRPVAKGAVKVPTAVLLACLLAAAGLMLLAATSLQAMVMGVLYLVLQALYNGGGKHLLLWDAMFVAGGFVLRALAGTFALRLPATEWFIMCTFLLALYLALAKRRQELGLADEAAPTADASMATGRAAEPSPMTFRWAARPSLAHYSAHFVDQAMHTSATLLLAAYSLYTFFGTSRWMMFTLPFAFYGVFRHMWLVHRRDLGDEAELVLKDRATLVNAVLWTLSVLLVQAGVPQAAWHALGTLGQA